MNKSEDDHSQRIKRASEEVARIEGGLQDIYSASRDIVLDAKTRYVLSAVQVLGHNIREVQDLVEKILLRHRSEAHRELARLLTPKNN